MAVKERIKEFAKSKEKSVRAFEGKCGLTIGYINAIRESISPEKIQSIVLCYPDLNVDWLLTGDGNMLKESVSNDNQKEKPEIYKKLIDEINELKERCARYERIIDEMNIRRNEELNKQTGS